MNEPIAVETHRSPIYVVRFCGKATPAQYEAYLAQMTALMRQPVEAKRIVINDASEWAVSTASERRMQSDWIRAHEHDLCRTVDAIGFVFSSALMRGALHAVFWLQPLPVSHEIFGRFSEALDWARERLASR